MSSLFVTYQNHKVQNWDSNLHGESSSIGLLESQCWPWRCFGSESPRSCTYCWFMKTWSISSLPISWKPFLSITERMQALFSGVLFISTSKIPTWSFWKSVDSSTLHSPPSMSRDQKSTVRRSESIARISFSSGSACTWRLEVPFWWLYSPCFSSVKLSSIDLFEGEMAPWNTQAFRFLVAILK